MGAISGLSYPATPGFPRCQLRQVSPCSPHASRHAQQPSTPAMVTPFRYVPMVGLSDFHLCQVVGALPPQRRFHVAQRRPQGGLGRRGESHPPAPFVAAPALLEACGFSVY